MKKISLPLILLTSYSLNSWAQENKPVSHLFYKPLKKEILTETSFSSKTTEYNNVSGGTREIEVEELREKISIGFTDKITFSIDIAHQDEEDTETLTSSETTNLRDGLTNPELEFNIRLSDQQVAGFYNDLKFSYSPDLFPAETANNEESGTVAKGGEIFTVGIAYGIDYDNISFKLGFDTILNGDTKVKDQNTEEETGIDQRTDFKLELNSQYRFNDKFSGNFIISDTIKGNSSNQAGEILIGQDVTDIGLSLNYAFNPNKSALTLNYTYSFIEDQYKTISGTTSKQTYDVEANSISASYKYRF